MERQNGRMLSQAALSVVIWFLRNKTITDSCKAAVRVHQNNRDSPLSFMLVFVIVCNVRLPGSGSVVTIQDWQYCTMKVGSQENTIF